MNLKRYVKEVFLEKLFGNLHYVFFIFYFLLY